MERKWWTLLAVSMGIFMLLLDITIVNVALPDIQRSLHSSFTDLQWVIDAYSLTLAALLLTAGSLGDRLGRRRTFAVGIALFTSASLLCGLATTPLFLNLARAYQGVGGAVMFSIAPALLVQEFHGPERGTAFGIFGAAIGASAAIGPLLGGILTQGLGWEWIFFVNIPVGAALIVITVTRLAESRNPNATGADWLGVATFTGALFLLVFALIRGNGEGWGSALIVSCLVGSVALLAAFVAIERVAANPMFELSLFRRPAFAGASIAAFCLSAGMFAMFLYLTLYLQNILGYSPLQAGLRFLPFTVLSFIVAPIAGRLSNHVPVRFLIGGGLAMVGTGLLLMHGLTAASGWTALLAGLLVAGAGTGLGNPPLLQTAVGVVSPERSGMASGINTTFRQVGIATGIAALGAIFQSHVENHATRLLTPIPGVGGQAHALAHAVATGNAQAAIEGAPPGARRAVAGALHESFVSGLNTILVVGGLVALAGGVLAVALIRSRDFDASAHTPAPVPAPAAETAVRA